MKKQQDEVPDFNPQFPVDEHEMDKGITKVKKEKFNRNLTIGEKIFVIPVGIIYLVLVVSVIACMAVETVEAKQAIPSDLAVEMVDNTVEAINEPVSSDLVAKNALLEGYSDLVPVEIAPEIVKEIEAVCLEENYPCRELVQIAFYESSFNRFAVGDGGFYSRGLYQISFHYHPDISDECAFSISCSTKWTIEQLKNNRGHLWSTYNKVR